MSTRRSFIKGLLGGAAAVAAVAVPALADTKTPYSFPREEIEYGESEWVSERARTKQLLAEVKHGVVSREYALNTLGLSDELKQFYNKQMLERAREQVIVSQSHARAMEWRKFGG